MKSLKVEKRADKKPNSPIVCTGIVTNYPETFAELTEIVSGSNSAQCTIMTFIETALGHFWRSKDSFGDGVREDFISVLELRRKASKAVRLAKLQEQMMELVVAQGSLGMRLATGELTQEAFLCQFQDLTEELGELRVRIAEVEAEGK